MAEGLFFFAVVLKKKGTERNAIFIVSIIVKMDFQNLLICAFFSI